MRHVSDQLSQPSMEVPTPKVTLLRPFLDYVLLSAVDVPSVASPMFKLRRALSFV